MRHLSLFTGAGGGELGAILLGWHTIGYVEWNEYCQRIIRARIDDGAIPNAPIFSDIKLFNSEGYAKSYQGMVDVISAGFPCQPFSVAGNRLGEDDEQNMWPETIRSIRTIGPRYCLLENVPGLLSNQYIGTIFRDLSESGYDARWKTISASEIGGPHRRERLFIVAYSNSIRCNEGNIQNRINPQGYGQWSSNIPNIYLERVGYRGIGLPNNLPMGDGVAFWLDQLKALGNGQVPAVVRAAWEILS